MITNRKVLVVDRDPHVVEIVAARLRRIGLEIVTATNGVAALDRLHDRPLPGLVVTGLSLGALDGVGLALAARDQDLAVPFLFLTANPALARRELARVALKAPVFDKLAGVELVAEYVRRIALRAA